MKLRDYWVIVRKGWKYIVASTVIGLIAGVAVTLLSTPMYSSTTGVFVSAQTADTTADLLQGSSFTQQRVKSYSDIATSPIVLDPVISSLGLDMTSAELAKQITTEVPLNTVLINITVKDSNANKAATIANAVGQSLATQVDAIEAPVRGQASPVRLSTVQPGQVSLKPDSPKLLVNLAIALLAGLVGGFGIAWLRETLDVRVRNGSDIEEIGHAGILGGITLDENVDENPLVVLTRPKSTRAEAFRQLRTNIQFIEAAEGRKTIVVSSSIPSEGKTSTISNLAIAMADAGMKVLLIDCDFRKPKIHKTFGLDGTVGFTNFLIGQAKWNDVVQPWGFTGKLDILPAGQIPPNPSELLGSEAMKKALAEAESQYDVVLVDSAPLLPVTDAAILSKITGGIVLVVNVGRTTKPQLQGAINHIDAVGGKIIGFVMNKIPTKGADAYYYYSYGYKYGYKYGYQYGYQYSYGDDSDAGSQSNKTRKKGKSSTSARATTSVKQDKLVTKA
jgi:capsular exopolysaccharide synthesis family protein